LRVPFLLASYNDFFVIHRVVDEANEMSSDGDDVNIEANQPEADETATMAMNKEDSCLGCKTMTHWTGNEVEDAGEGWE
jgi:hypothetical protein